MLRRMKEVIGMEREALKVLLINPRQSYPIKLASEFQSYFPVGLASLASSLETIGVNVKIIDCLSYNKKKEYDSIVQFGLSDEDLSDQVMKFQPDIVGITNPFSMFIDDALATAALIKKIDPHLPVIMGGLFPSIAPYNRELLAPNKNVDILVVGEGEATIKELVENFDVEKKIFSALSNIRGILYRGDQGNIVETPRRPFIDNLDSIPIPAYHLIDFERMFSNPYYAKYRRRTGYRCLPVHTSRGCPYTCNFCSVHTQVGYKYRNFSVEYVKKHLSLLKTQYGVSHVHFEDDNFTLDREHTKDLLNELVDLQLTWDTPNGIRADSVDLEMAEVMSRSGAVSVSIAVESGNQDVIDKIIRKRLDLNKVVSAVEALSEFDIMTMTFFVIGFPGETEEHIRQTLRFAKYLSAKYNTVSPIFVATPYIGTPLYRECIEKNLFVIDRGYSTALFGIRLSQAPLIQTKEFGKEDLFNWTKDELDQPGFFTSGKFIPTFWSDNEKAWSKRMMVSPGFDRKKNDYWSNAVFDRTY